MLLLLLLLLDKAVGLVLPADASTAVARVAPASAVGELGLAWGRLPSAAKSRELKDLLSVMLRTFNSRDSREDLSRAAAAAAGAAPDPWGAVMLLLREKKLPSREAVGESCPVKAARLS